MSLILGPVLRYTNAHDATVWVETEAACEVEVLVNNAVHHSPTFHVCGHHYAIVYITGLEPGRSYTYEVRLGGRKVWPEPGSSFPPSTIRTIDPAEPLQLAFGSCRASRPHEPPYTLSSEEHELGYDNDALYTLALRMRGEPEEHWPLALLLLGDQIYADDVSLGALEFIRSRRDTSQPPGEEVADFEEYTRLYWDSWSEPAIRWLLSTIPSAMIFDDHDVNDDWNTSETWVEQMRSKPWWHERITGGFMSYWIYQHLGNLSPSELAEDELFEEVREADDAGPILREFAHKADRDARSYRWSFHRDYGNTRLVVMDSRAGRILGEGKRSMVDDVEWDWIVDHSTGDFAHLLLGTSLPAIMPPAVHHIESWNEAVCAGAWGKAAARQGERIRQALDLEHWPAFQRSFDRLVGLLKEVASGERGPAPASVVLLSGDVHHTYLAEVDLHTPGARSAVYQATCSPLRNSLPKIERRVFRTVWSKAGELAAHLLARAAGIEAPSISWRLTHEKPWFDNHIATLELEGRRASLKLEKTVSEDPVTPQLEKVFEYHLA